MDVKTVASGLTKKAAHELGHKLRREGKIAFVYPSATVPGKRDVVVAVEADDELTTIVEASGWGKGAGHDPRSEKLPPKK